MRFLILTQYYAPEVGAAQVRLQAMAIELRRLGHDVEVVTAMPNYPVGRVRDDYRGRLWMRERLEGIRITRTWIYAASGRNVALRMLNYLSFTVTGFFGALRCLRPDVVVIESPPLFLGLSGYLIARLRGARVVLNVSDLWPTSAKELGIVTNPHLIALAERLERFLYRHVDVVSAVTRGIHDAVKVVAPDKRVVTMLNSVDIDLFHRVPVPEPPGVATFIYAGTHGYVSGLDVILDAAALLRERPDIRFRFVGDGAEKARLKTRAKEMGLSNVTFDDPLPVWDMPAAYSGARASLVPLRRDDFFKRTIPAKLFPSLACATPVIHCGNGEAATLIRNTRVGLVVPPERPEELAAAVVQLAEQPQSAREMGERGRKLVEERYSWRRTVARWVAELLPAEVGQASARS